MERKGHYLPCGSLRQAVAQASRALRGRKLRKQQAPIDPSIALNITGPYKVCMGELAQRKWQNGCICRAYTPTLPFKVEQIKEVSPYTASARFKKAPYSVFRCSCIFQR